MSVSKRIKSCFSRHSSRAKLEACVFGKKAATKRRRSGAKRRNRAAARRFLARRRG